MKNTITEFYPTIEIGQKPKNTIEVILQFFCIIRPYKMFQLTPIKIGVRHEVSKIVVSLPKNMMADGFEMSVMNIDAAHLDKIIKIVGLCLVNKEKGPSKRLLNRIRNEFSVEDLNKTMALIRVQLNLGGFASMINLMIGQSLLVTNGKVEVKLPPGVNSATNTPGMNLQKN